MSEECRNDCLEPFVFPRKIENRPGLPHINYRIGTYSDFLEALLRNLNKNAVLSSWTHRKADDPGIALLEGTSILGDILTFYQELYANEAYLRTAQWRESISDLVRLLGYRLSPGLGGKATFAFEVKGDKPVIIPKGFPIKAQVVGSEQPVNFETTKENIAYPWLSKFNLYRRLYTPYITQDTKEFYIFSPDQYISPIKIEKGDRLFVGDRCPSDPRRFLNSEVVIVDDTSTLHGHTIIKIKGALKRTTAADYLLAYKIGRTFRHFGHNAPLTKVTVSDGVVKEEVVDPMRDLTKNPMGYSFESDQGSRAFPLDSEVLDLPLNTVIICDAVLYTWDFGDIPIPSTVTMVQLRMIRDIRQMTFSWGSLTGKSTVLILGSTLALTTDPAVDLLSSSPITFDLLDIRDIQFHETLSPILTLKARPRETADLTGSELYFYGTNSQAKVLKDRKILLSKKGSDPVEANVLTVQALGPYFAERPFLRRITLNTEVTYVNFQNENPTVTVYGNLVEATQGKTEKEAVLGNGDSRQTFQTFKLPKAPLTYYNSSGETPPEVPELQIYVNDRLWKRVPSFFGREPKDEIYIVREDANGDSWVQFGDGKTGARLPSGIKNVVAKYRTGTGAYGTLKEGTTVQPGGKLDRLNKIQLPGVVSGGSEPEIGDNAREAAPGKVQSLDRLVSLKDFESEALAIPGVSKVKARWDLVDNIPTVILTVLMEKGGSGEIKQSTLTKEETCIINKEVQDIINDYNRCRGPQRFPVCVCQGKRRYIYIDVVFGLHPAYREELVKRAIKETLGVTGEEGIGIDGSKGLFGLHQRQFGQNEYATRIEGTIQNVEGVVWAKVKAFGLFQGESDEPSELSFSDEPKPLNPIVSCDNLHILSLYKDHLQLSVSKVESTEEC
ncbi:MAG: hypothetical protein AB1480_05185 [Nitrospirota bacterium]